MKQGLEIKKLGEVCRLMVDGDWIESKDQSDNGIRLLQTGNVGIGCFKDKSEHYKFISEETFDRLNCTEIFEGDILISRLPEPIGRACIVPTLDCRMITAVDCSIIRLQDIVLPKYVVYYTRSNKYGSSIEQYVTGAVRKRISRSNLAKIPIPVPERAEQERIVGELDCLSGIIAAKRAQLRELDTLAQSIFYTMFGDSITNDKGWQTKKIGDVGKIITGNTPSTKDIENYSAEDYCFVKPSDISKNGVSKIDRTEFYVSTKAYNCSRQLPEGSVLTTCIGIIGKVGILAVDAICNQQINAIIPLKTINSTYLAYSILFLRDNLEIVANAPIVPIINKGEFSKVIIPIPPIDLQQQFAEKIDNIERQKELITKSIKETEDLFNSRMDYYFN